MFAVVRTHKTNLVKLILILRRLLQRTLDAIKCLKISYLALVAISSQVCCLAENFINVRNNFRVLLKNITFAGHRC